MSLIKGQPWEGKMGKSKFVDLLYHTLLKYKKKTKVSCVHTKVRHDFWWRSTGICFFYLIEAVGKKKKKSGIGSTFSRLYIEFGEKNVLWDILRV